MTSKVIRCLLFCIVLILLTFNIVAKTQHHDHTTSDDVKTPNHHNENNHNKNDSNENHHERSSDSASLSSHDGTGREDTDDTELKRCVNGFDVVQMQSRSSSFGEYGPEIKQSMSSVTHAIKKLGTGGRFGYLTYGWGHCPHVRVPLGHPSPEMTEALRDGDTARLTEMEDRDDADLEALYYGLSAPEMDWKAKDQNVLKTAILITDTVPALEDNARRLMSDTIENVREEIEQISGSIGCDAVKYKSLENIAQIAKDEEILVVVLVGHGGSIDENGNFTPDSSLAAKGEKYQGREGPRLWYNDRMRKAGFTHYVVLSLDDPEHMMSKSDSAREKPKSVYARWVEELIDTVPLCK